MAARTIILIRDRDDAERMELAEFTEPHEAERYLEQLLVDGVPPDAVRVFNAVELDMQVSHRPVVSLNTGGEQAQAAPQPQDPAPAAANSEIQQPGAVPEANGAAAGPTTETREQPFVRDGVRFSELFKPAGG